MSEWIEEKFEQFRSTLTPGDRVMTTEEDEAKRKKLELQQNRELLKAIKKEDNAVNAGDDKGKGGKGKKGKGKGKGKSDTSGFGNGGTKNGEHLSSAGTEILQ